MFSYGLPIIESLSLLIQNFLNLGSAKLQEIANSKIENIWTNINLFLQTPIDLTKNAVDYVKTHSITKDQTENYFEQMLTGKDNLSQLYYTNEIPYYKDGGFFYTSTHLDHAADYDQTQRSWYKQSAGNDGKPG